MVRGWGGGGGGQRRVVPKKPSVTKPYIAVLKKDLLFRHIELSKGVSLCRKSRLQMFQICKKDLKLIDIDFRQARFPLFCQNVPSCTIWRCFCLQVTSPSSPFIETLIFQVAISNEVSIGGSSNLSNFFLFQF